MSKPFSRTPVSSQSLRWRWLTRFEQVKLGYVYVARVWASSASQSFFSARSFVVSYLCCSGALLFLSAMYPLFLVYAFNDTDAAFLSLERRDVIGSRSTIGAMPGFWEPTLFTLRIANNLSTQVTGIVLIVPSSSPRNGSTLILLEFWAFTATSFLTSSSSILASSTFGYFIVCTANYPASFFSSRSSINSFGIYLLLSLTALTWSLFDAGPLIFL